MTIHAPHDKGPVVAYEKISDDEVNDKQDLLMRSYWFHVFYC